MATIESFDRFIDDEHITVVNKDGLTFCLKFYNGKDSDDEDDDYDGFRIETWTKEYEADRDCLCPKDDDGSLYESCCDEACNWNHESKVLHATSANTCLHNMIKMINNIVYCNECGRAHNGEGVCNSVCSSCFLQRLVHQHVDVVANCPVCMEDFTKPSERKLGCCSNKMCRRCFRNLKEPKACPFCRCVQ
jgi:hypothetical protein